MYRNQHLKHISHILGTSHRFSNKATNGTFSLGLLLQLFDTFPLLILKSYINEHIFNACIMCLLKLL